MTEDLRMELKKVEWELEEIDKALTVIYDKIEAYKLPRAIFVILYWITFTLGLSLTWAVALKPEIGANTGMIAATLAVCAMAFCAAMCASQSERKLEEYHKRLDEIQKRLDWIAEEVEDDD